MLFVRLTLQTTFSLCQFDSDTETEYIQIALFLLLALFILYFMYIWIYVDAFEALKSEALQSALFSFFIMVLTQLQENDTSFEVCSAMKRPACFEDDLGGRLTVVFLSFNGGGLTVITHSDDNDNRGVFLTS